MWAESDCKSWLDSKPKHYVLYVSFGSYAHVSKAQIHEMAMGLLHSKRPFLWVLRPDIVASDVQDILPERLIVHVWEVAMSLGQIFRSSNNMRSTLVTRQEIAVIVAEFMEIDGQKGKKLRSNVGSVREVMKKAAMNGGSSQNNLEGL
ncbi:hypothetical protein SUGI_1205110 [Cryptomeria japonica]|nr:hypothetical protein SUGI_1205110 [Cryptomeria japonica]